MTRGGAVLLERPAATLRCAVYTRKSTEEGLEQEFNSLDAQREACEAFVRSQRGEGWTLLPDRYDDGGYSGANTERPALRRLMADVEAGRVQVVLVYKLDRLSRSLLDFTRMMETFDARRVAFVSVTQKFDTSTSMGRLMLHILLSFAQFEREMIAERTRDKMSAARRRGKWVGGMPPLGYDVAEGGGRLVVNEEEARRVREIFATYLREQSLLATAREANARGWTTKSWTTRGGRRREGRPFDKVNVRSVLTNRTYTGKVATQGTVVPGEHEAIVSEADYLRAQALLRHNARTGGKRVRNRHGALLRDLLRCAPCDAGMVHTWTQKGTKRYRYYVCARAQREGWAACPTKAVPVEEVERFVVERIRGIGADPSILAATTAEARAQQAAEIDRLRAEVTSAERRVRSLEAAAVALSGRQEAGERAAALERVRDAERRLTGEREALAAVERTIVGEEDLAAALSLFDPVWEALFPRERARILRLLIERVTLDGGAGSLAITFRPTGIRALAAEVADAAEAVR